MDPKQVIGGLIVIIVSALAAQYSKQALWIALFVSLAVFVAICWQDWFGPLYRRVGVTALLSVAAMVLVGGLTWVLLEPKPVSGPVKQSSSAVEERPTSKLPTAPCAAEIGREAPLPPPASGATFDVIEGTLSLRANVYAEVRTVRFEKYLHGNNTAYALCAPIYILNQSAERLNLRFEAIEVAFSDKAKSEMWRTPNGIETFNLQTALGPGEETNGCFRFFSLGEEDIRNAKRTLLIKELNTNLWIPVPITGIFPPAAFRRSASDTASPPPSRGGR